MLVSAPEDYGLSPDATLAHRVEGGRPRAFDAYWRTVREEVTAQPDTWRGAVDEAPSTVVIPSIRGVRVVARVTLPSDAPRAVVVTTHGSGAPEDFPDGPEPWAAHGLVTVRLRVRGYPPSTLDVDDRRADWILHAFGAAESWILRGAVADVLQACRCARRQFPDLPLVLHGESFGGGLAVIAAAQLGRLDADLAPRRLALGLPSFGDWRWRRGRYCRGTGGLVNMMLESLRQDQGRAMETLLLFDAALHAADVRAPVLCKLACRDDVVPAPSAAAVCNGLASDERWRFVTAYGHFDGGLQDLRAHALFERLHPPFLDPGQPPAAVIGAAPTPAAGLLDRLPGGA